MMQTGRKLGAVLAAIIVVAAGPSSTRAHGGVEQSAANSVVSFFQEPLSTFVNEPVTMTFIVRDTARQAVPDLPVTIVVTESVDADEAHDQTVDRRTTKTDANGAITLTKVFPRPNYFDVELTFRIPNTDQDETVGFLLQPAQPRKDWPLTAGISVGALILGIFLGWLLARRNIVQITSSS